MAGASPGNNITFSSGEMPIVNKLSTIMPMAAGLHQHLPEPATGQYSDATMPTTSNSDTVNFLDNVIDGESLVKARVEQAKIWNEQLKPKIEKLAAREHVQLNERDGSLSSLVMNTVYELYDKQSGQSRDNLSDPIPYWKKALQMCSNIKTISNTKLDQDERMNAIKMLKEELVKCILDPNLDDLTKIYADTKPSTNVNVGFDENAVAKFVTAFMQQYPKPEALNLEHQDVYSKAHDDPRYHDYEGNEEKEFDFLNISDEKALNEYLQDVVLGTDSLANGLDMKHAEGSNLYRVMLGDKNLWKATTKQDENGNLIFADTKFSQNDNLEKAIAENGDLMSKIQVRLNDDN